GLRAILHLPDRPTAATWLAPAQAVVAVVVVALSVWLSLAFDSPRSFAGALATALLLPSGVLLARGAEEEWGRFFRWMTLLLVVLLGAEVGWAVIGPEAAALWLHRGVVLMTALALAAGVYSLLPRWLPEEWGDSARRLGPILLAGTVAA